MKTVSREQIEFYKKQYPPGTRVQLDRMGDDPRPIPAGTKGTVVAVDDIGQRRFCETYQRERSGL